MPVASHSAGSSWYSSLSWYSVSNSVSGPLTLAPSCSSENPATSPVRSLEARSGSGALDVVEPTSWGSNAWESAELEDGVAGVVLEQALSPRARATSDVATKVETGLGIRTP